MFSEPKQGSSQIQGQKLHLLRGATKSHCRRAGRVGGMADNHFSDNLSQHDSMIAMWNYLDKLFKVCIWKSSSLKKWHDLHQGTTAGFLDSCYTSVVPGSVGSTSLGAHQKCRLSGPSPSLLNQIQPFPTILKGPEYVLKCSERLHCSFYFQNWDRRPTTYKRMFYS